MLRSRRSPSAPRTTATFVPCRRTTSVSSLGLAPGARARSVGSCSRAEAPMTTYPDGSPAGSVPATAATTRTTTGCPPFVSGSATTASCAERDASSDGASPGPAPVAGPACSRTLPAASRRRTDRSGWSAAYVSISYRRSRRTSSVTGRPGPAVRTSRTSASAARRLASSFSASIRLAARAAFPSAVAESETRVEARFSATERSWRTYPAPATAAERTRKTTTGAHAPAVSRSPLSRSTAPPKRCADRTAIAKTNTALRRTKRTPFALWTVVILSGSTTARTTSSEKMIQRRPSAAYPTAAARAVRRTPGAAGRELPSAVIPLPAERPRVFRV